MQQKIHHHKTHNLHTHTHIVITIIIKATPIMMEEFNTFEQLNLIYLNGFAKLNSKRYWKHSPKLNSKCYWNQINHISRLRYRYADHHIRSSMSTDMLRKKRYRYNAEKRRDGNTETEVKYCKRKFPYIMLC